MNGVCAARRPWPSRQQFNIRDYGRSVVADQAADRFTAKLSVLFFVNLLEQRTLIPSGALELLERLAEIHLGDVHEAYLQHLIGFSIVDQMLQSAPSAFQLLEILMMEYEIDLFGQLAVDLGDDRLNRLDDVATDELVCASACSASVRTAARRRLLPHRSSA